MHSYFSESTTGPETGSETPRPPPRIFERVAEGVERRDHVRPRVCERVHVGPLGNDAVGALPVLASAQMSGAWLSSLAEEYMPGCLA
jgi:hypothetical protein